LDNYVTTSPRIPQKRIHRIAVSSFFFLAGLCFASWASRIPAIQLKLGLSNAALGTVLLGLPCGLFVSLPVAGWSVARYGSKIIAMGAATLYAITLPLLGIAHNKIELFGTLFLFGMGGNLLNISMNTQAVGTENLYGRSIMASYHGLWSLAGFTGAAAGTLFVGLGLAPFTHFLVIGSLALGIVITASRYLLGEDVNRQEKQPLLAKPDGTLISLGLIAFCSMICEGAMFDWSGVYFQKVVQPVNGMVTAGYTAFMSTMATGRFVGDWVTTKVGKQKTLLASGILTATGLLIAVVFPYFLSALLGFLFVGAGVSSVVPLIYSSAGKSKQLSPGVAIAAVSTIGYLGFLFGPPCIGFIAQISSLRWSLGIIALLGSAIAFISYKTKME
jgi:MFS family permease